MSEQSEGSRAQPAGPALSAVLVAPGSYATVRRTMDHLQAQTAAGQIEVVLITPSRRQLGLDESEMSRFHSWQIVEVGEDSFIGAAYAVGIRQAHAPVVALTEDHAFPEANWAEVLIGAHRGPWAAVGPSFRNGNPETLLSWADFCHAYSYWAVPISPGPVQQLPGHNASYKRDVLLGFGSDLDVLMEVEGVLHRLLRAQGHDLLLEPATCTMHLNFTSWSAWARLRYYIGRQFAATWARPWSRRRRLLFTAASPLIPWIRLWRIQKRARKVMPRGLVVRVLPIVLLGLLIEWPGQAIGFAAGPGNSSQQVDKLEQLRFG